MWIYEAINLAAELQSQESLQNILAVRLYKKKHGQFVYESFATVGEIRVYRRADFQSGSRVLKKVF